MEMKRSDGLDEELVDHDKKLTYQLIRQTDRVRERDCVSKREEKKEERRETERKGGISEGCKKTQTERV